MACSHWSRHTNCHSIHSTHTPTLYYIILCPQIFSKYITKRSATSHITRLHTTGLYANPLISLQPIKCIKCNGSYLFPKFFHLINSFYSLPYNHLSQIPSFIAKYLYTFMYATNNRNNHPGNKQPKTPKISLTPSAASTWGATTNFF